MATSFAACGGLLGVHNQKVKQTGAVSLRLGTFQGLHRLVFVSDKHLASLSWSKAIHVHRYGYNFLASFNEVQDTTPVVQALKISEDG